MERFRDAGGAAGGNRQRDQSEVSRHDGRGAVRGEGARPLEGTHTDEQAGLPGIGGGPARPLAARADHMDGAVVDAREQACGKHELPIAPMREACQSRG